MADVNSAANSTAVLDGYLTRENLAAQLGKSMRTIDRWEMHRSGPPRVLIGKTVLYRLESVRAWLLSCEQRRGEPRRRRPRKAAQVERSA
jgi:predicted DNA-binding transcriptional regulator AlpA